MFEFRSAHPSLGPSLWTLANGSPLFSSLPQLLPIQQGDLHIHIRIPEAACPSSGHSPPTLQIAYPWPPWSLGICALGMHSTPPRTGPGKAQGHLDGNFRVSGSRNMV